MPKTSPKPLPKITQRVSDQFWSHVEKSPNCWHWTAARSSSGYGKIGIGTDLSYYTHRVAYAIFYGIDPFPLAVLHKCDNRICVRPDHLFLGTLEDNIHDCIQKGRNCFGEKNSQTKLTSEQVMEIRKAVQNGTIQRTLAKQYRVTPATICRIIKRAVWKHV